MNNVPVLPGMMPVANFAATFAALERRADDPFCVREALAQDALTDDALNYDPVTGMATRDWFRVQLGLAIVRAKQEHKQVGLLLLDMDNLDAVIDHLGPAVGSELWQQVASRVVGCLRDSDTAGRMSQNELLVLLPEIAGEQRVSELVVELHRSLVAPYTVDGQAITLTASIGAAVYPNEGSIHEDLIRHSCMYLSTVHNRVSRCLLQKLALSPAELPGRLL